MVTKCHGVQYICLLDDLQSLQKNDLKRITLRNLKIFPNEQLLFIIEHHQTKMPHKTFEKNILSFL